MKKLTCGYAEHGPQDGLGPFRSIFDFGKRLLYEDSLEGCDAIVLWGGADISPSLYDAIPIAYSGPPKPSERDLFEWALIIEAVKKKIPIIGICRGAQMLCAYAGGTLIQDVNGHQGNHLVETYDGRTFAGVTSAHHQMMFPYKVKHELLSWSNVKRANGWYKPSDSESSIAMKEESYQEPEVVYFPEIDGFAIQSHPEWEQKSAYTDWCLSQFLTFSDILKD